MSKNLAVKTIDSINSIRFFSPIGKRLEQAGITVDEKFQDKLYEYADACIAGDSEKRIREKILDYMSDRGVLNDEQRSNIAMEYMTVGKSKVYSRIYKSLSKDPDFESFEIQTRVNEIYSKFQSDLGDKRIGHIDDSGENLFVSVDAPDSCLRSINIVTGDWLKQNFEIIQRNSDEFPALSAYSGLLGTMASNRILSGVLAIGPGLGGAFSIVYTSGDLQRYLDVTPENDGIKFRLFDSSGDGFIKMAEKTADKRDLDAKSIMDFLHDSDKEVNLTTRISDPVHAETDRKVQPGYEPEYDGLYRDF